MADAGFVSLLRYYCATQYPVDNTLDGNSSPGSACEGGGPDPLPVVDGSLRPARHSPDPVLNALAQLTAWKLDARRAYINIIDHTTHHIIAEATRTVSLRSHRRHGPDDQLYCGLQALPVAWGICPSTIHCFSDPNSEYAVSTDNITSNMSYYLIRDLSSDDAYKDRPYVAGWPFMRSYAEVPLKSPAGFVIGSLAIIDDRHRRDLTPDELLNLEEIALAVMQHLERIRLEHDSKYGSRLMQGLSSFVQNASDQATRDPGAISQLSLPPDRGVISEQVTPPHSETPKGSKSEQRATTIFSHASRLIQQSMDLDGVVFFDARKSLGSPSSSHRLMCEKLGLATKSDATESNILTISQELLHQLATKFSKGKIFNFDDLGLVNPAPEDAGSGASTPRTWSGTTDAAPLSATFPGAHSIIFFPLPGAEGRFYAGCFGWTFDAKRALQSEEITCFSAFSNSVMSEIFRLEAVAMDRAKSNFISSISHELRSPLHGILASAELLQACSSGADQDDLIHMVHTCGRTLLDTMNHLFDYAKITNSSRADAAPSNNNQLSLSMSARSVLDLSQLVEEVVEAVYTGHNFAQNSSVISPAIVPHIHAGRSISVVLDINGSSNWMFKSEAGAWRRVVMNLFGNALKYTHAGCITISLRASRPLQTVVGPRSTMVEFQVVDTGRGISQEYLKNRLYTPFAQEDSLSVGTGLGLSIVRGVVSALGGSMDIKSQAGAGTTVTVLTPVEAAAEESSDSLASSTTTVFRAIREKSPTYIFLQHASAIQASGRSSFDRLSSTLESWFGMRRIPDATSTNPDIVIADEAAVLSKHIAWDPNGGTNADQSSAPYQAVPRLILGTDFPTPLIPAQYRQHRISQPFGPHKLAGAVADLLSIPREIYLPTVDRPEDGVPLQQSSSSLKRSHEEMDNEGRGRDINGKLGAFIDDNRTRFAPQGHFEAPLPVGVARSETVSPPPPPPPSLLLVDDNEINLRLISTYIQRLSCRYQTAANGQQAVACYENAFRERRPFDIVLMDMTMPVMNGFEATQEIRAFEKKHHIAKPARIIALTGLTSSKSQQDAAASGIDLFLTKPLQLSRLKAVLGLV